MLCGCGREPWRGCERIVRREPFAPTRLEGRPAGSRLADAAWGYGRVRGMLERLRLTDFKSFVDEEAELSPLTLLVGANASGKSNFLDALRFLQQTAFDISF